MTEQIYFEKLRASFSDKNKLEILTEFNTVITAISQKFIYGIENPENLNEVLSIIKGQKNITEVSESFYDYLQGEVFEIEVANEYMDKLEYACERMKEVGNFSSVTEIIQENS